MDFSVLLQSSIFYQRINSWKFLCYLAGSPLLYCLKNHGNLILVSSTYLCAPSLNGGFLLGYLCPSYNIFPFFYFCLITKFTSQELAQRNSLICAAVRSTDAKKNSNPWQNRVNSRGACLPAYPRQQVPKSFTGTSRTTECTTWSSPTYPFLKLSSPQRTYSS